MNLNNCWSRIREPTYTYFMESAPGWMHYNTDIIGFAAVSFLFYFIFFFFKHKRKKVKINKLLTSKSYPIAITPQRGERADLYETRARAGFILLYLFILFSAFEQVDGHWHQTQCADYTVALTCCIGGVLPKRIITHLLKQPLVFILFVSYWDDCDVVRCLYPTCLRRPVFINNRRGCYEWHLWASAR